MTQFADYLIETKIYESSRTAVYRGRASASAQAVILKILQPTQTTPESIARFRREFEVTRHLSGSGIIKAIALVEFENTQAIVLEDFGGSALVEQLKESGLTTAVFLPLALKICNALESVHSQHLIHKDINPANIVWNTQTGAVKIIDFGLATTLSRENPEISNPHILEGTIPYISPEQTGRMNRAMDYRSDFYSLGVTFYQLVAGRLPFTTKDPLELVHSHIARQPVPPHELVKSIPPVLSDIIMRLMAKNAEERYQSAYGLRQDLEQCWQQWQENESLTLFPLGRQDVTSRFHLPQKLYGRAAETSALQQSFSRISDPESGNLEVVLVTGQAGVGKSALVQELFKPVTASRGYYISGKFDQLQNAPYAPLLQAFNTLLNQILTESEAEITNWRHALHQALGANGQVLIEVMPALEYIVGPQTAVPELPPAEAETRFNLTFQNFITVFTRPEHPLVLFLDDWQWMDGASRQLLQSLLTMGQVHHLLLIGAFRDNELSLSHPVRLLIDKLERAGTAVTTLPLKPLPLPELNQYVADTLHTDPGQSLPLAELLLSKTAGNPFFLGEFLKSLHVDELITFDSTRGKWTWDIQQINEQHITDNVVNLMTANIQKMLAETQKSLTLAACIGNRFELNTLAQVQEQPAQKTITDLWPAVANGLIVPLSDAYKFAEYDEALAVTYKFAHDRVQQAAYALIPENEQQAIHLKIGSHLLKSAEVKADDGRIFEIVNHLNLGRQQLNDGAEIKRLARLNLQASQTAVEAAAFQSAFEYGQIGIELLNKKADLWQDEYDLALQVVTTAVEAAFQSGNYQEMETWADTALHQAKHLLDKIPIYTNIFMAYLAQNKIGEAVDEALPLLKELGVNLPANPSQRHLVLALLQTRLTLRGKSTIDLLNLPPMTDPEKIAVVETLMSVGGAAYFFRPQLFALMILIMVQHYAKYGMHPSATRAFAAFGLMQAGYLNNMEAGVAYGRLGLDLVEKLHVKEHYAQTAQIYYHYLSHWITPLRHSLEPVKEAYQIALETGNLTQASYCAYTYSTHAIYAGLPLDNLIPEMEQYSLAMQQLNQDKILYVYLMFLQVIANLNSFSAKEPWCLDGQYFNESEGEAAYLAADDQPAYCTYLVQKGTLYYLFGEAEQAKKYFDEVAEREESVAATYMVSAIAFLDALTHLELLKKGEYKNKKAYLKRVTSQLKKLKKWAEAAPLNYQHKYDLVAAELAAFRGRQRQARKHFEDAIDNARNSGFLQEEALAYELAGSYFFSRQNGRLAKYHFKQAYQAYTLWGAQAKVKQIEAQYPQFFTRETYKPAAKETTKRSRKISSTVSTSSASATAVLDLGSVIKASQALSSVIKLDDLLDHLMVLAIENAGAQSGYLLLLEDDHWQTVAYGGEATPDNNLPASILNYVSRSRETIVLDDATAKGQFMQDPVILATRPKSILCLPLIHHREVIGILYLENNITSGAFTQERLTVLNLLASQAAISIENARLVTQLEDYGRNLQALVEQRTADLTRVNQQAQEARSLAEKANENKSVFLSNMSREMRTPLNTIIGFTRLVKQKGKGQLPEKQENNLNKVLVSADHLLSLINTVIDIAKIEAGGMDVKCVKFDPEELIESCLVTAQPLLKKEVSLHKEITNDCPSVYSDPAKIKQIIINLLSNAAKFTHQGQINVHSTHQDNIWQVIISDTGIGISEEALPRIFEEFEQAESTTRQNYGGTGLGLPISLSLARLLGGNLTANSHLGMGSTFTLTIPVHYSANGRETGTT